MISKLNYWDKVYSLICLLILLTPQIVFLLFQFGVPIIYHQINIIIDFILIIFSFYYLIKNKNDKLFFLIPLISLIVFILAFIGSLQSVFSINEFGKLLGLLISIMGAPFLSIFILKHYRNYGNILFHKKILKYSGVFISIINIIYFILLYSNKYGSIYAYTEFIGLGMYIEDLGSFFIRPAGYFFDYHSQYYIPIISLFITINEKKNNSKLLKITIIFLIIFSILISGVKSAYLTLIVCLIYSAISSSSFLTILKFFLFGSVILFLGDLLLDSFFSDLAIRIVTHDLDILIEHISEVPILLYNTYNTVFFLGGQVDFQNYIYSEVYYVTIIYYIGIIGLIIVFLFPILFLIFKKTDVFTKIITLIFAMSLMHYYVFKISFNIVGTSLFYFYFFKNLFLKQNAK